MNQKLKDYFLERAEYLPEEYITLLVTMYKHGQDNMTQIGKKAGIQKHMVNPIISMFQILGLVEFANPNEDAQRSKEQIITPFGIEFLKVIGKLPEEKEEPKVIQLFSNDTIEINTIIRIFNLIRPEKKNTATDIAELIGIDKEKAIIMLDHLYFTNMLDRKKDKKNKNITRFYLTPLAEIYNNFLRKKGGEKEILENFRLKVPRLYNTLLLLRNGQHPNTEEIEHLKTIGLFDGISLTEEGRQLVKYIN